MCQLITFKTAKWVKLTLLPIVFVLTYVIPTTAQVNTGRILVIERNNNRYCYGTGNLLRYKDDDDYFNSVIIHHIDSSFLYINAINETQIPVGIDGIATVYQTRTSGIAKLGNQAAVLLPAAGLIYFLLDYLNGGSANDGRKLGKSTPYISGSLIGVGAISALLTRDRRLKANKWRIYSRLPDGYRYRQKFSFEQ